MPFVCSQPEAMPHMQSLIWASDSYEPCKCLCRQQLFILLQGSGMHRIISCPGDAEIAQGRAEQGKPAQEHPSRNSLLQTAGPPLACHPLPTSADLPPLLCHPPAAGPHQYCNIKHLPLPCAVVTMWTTSLHVCKCSRWTAVQPSALPVDSKQAASEQTLLRT